MCCNLEVMLVVRNVNATHLNLLYTICKRFIAIGISNVASVKNDTDLRILLFKALR